MEDHHSHVLRAVQAFDGKGSWYQIDRFLAQRGVLPDRLMNIVTELVDLGLIEVVSMNNAGQPVYGLTQTGRARVT